MNSGIYTLTSALMAQEQRVASTAQNLANVSSDGFKVVARSVEEARAPGASSRSGDALAGAVNATVRLGAGAIDLTQGRIAPTHEPFDIAIDGPGFLAVQTSAGVAWTRSGHLKALEGRLVTLDGYPVLGAAGPVRIGEGEILIEADGTVKSGGNVAGRLRIEVFEPKQLSSLGGSLLRASEPGKPAAGTRILQGSIEESTVRPLEEVTSLIESQRGFEMYQRALGIILNEVDRRAVNDLGSVS